MNIDNKSGGADWEERIYFMDNLRAVAMFLSVIGSIDMIDALLGGGADVSQTRADGLSANDLYFRFHGSRIVSLNSGKIDVAGKSSLPF